MNYHIKPFLKGKGYNLSKLASLMDMSFQKFDHHVRPKEDLSFNFVTKLSSHLDMSVDDFISNVSIPKEVEENVEAENK